MTSQQVGVLVSARDDRLLLCGLLRDEGYHCWAPSPADLEAEASSRMPEASLLIVEDSVADWLGPRLLAQRQTVVRYLPIVVVLQAGAEASAWLAEGYDDVIRLPQAPEELRARLNFILRHQQRSVVLLEAANRELRRKNTELETARDDAERADRAKAEFLANMSHELKTPLHGILGCVEILKQQLESSEHLEMIETSGRSLLGMMKELLDYATFEGRGTGASLQVVETKDHLLEILSPSISHAASKGIELRIEFQGPLPQYSEVDSARLSQVLDNLVGNAIKFTEEGHVTVVLSWNTGRLEVEVSDTGVGIPENQHEDIFQPFVQVDSSTTRPFEGAGLGLAMVKKIMEAVRGSISLESQLGKGSTFKATVPMSESQGPPSEQTEEPGESRSLRVLVVEDNPINSKVLSRLLEHWGHQCEVASSGARGVELAATAPYDIIVMDVQMPKMSGLEATRQIRSRELEGGAPRTPIIALTARDREEDRDLCLASGMDEYLSKPPDYQKLRRLLQTLTSS